jgi:hypothetical protein
MADVVQTAISGSPVKSGGITCKVNKNTVVNKDTSLGKTPDLTAFEAKNTTRFDDTQYYTA